MTRAMPRSHSDRLRNRSRSRLRWLVLSLALSTAAACLAGCAKPLPRGDGPTTLVVKAAISAPTGRMVGRARIEVIDYEDRCPRLFDRTLFGMRKAVEVVAKNDPPVQVGLTPGHVYKVSLQHRGAGGTKDRACESIFWFKPSTDARYAIALQSDLDSCAIRQAEPHASPLTPYPTCEQAKASGEPGASAASDADAQTRD